MYIIDFAIHYKGLKVGFQMIGQYKSINTGNTTVEYKIKKQVKFDQFIHTSLINIHYHPEASNHASRSNLMCVWNSHSENIVNILENKNSDVLIVLNSFVLFEN